MITYPSLGKRATIGVTAPSSDVEEDLHQDLSDELQIPIVYDIDCGHVPPQITFVNGAYGVVEVEEGKGIVVQYFKE